MNTKKCFSSSLPALFLIIVGLSVLSSVVPTAHAVTLLSDKTIAQIYGGQQVIIEVENGSAAFFTIDDVYWGDADGFGNATSPGYIDIQVPYKNFQYDAFRYQFNTKEDADAFIEALDDLTYMDIEVEDTEFFYKVPNAQDIGINDTTGREIDYVIVTTDRSVPSNIIQNHRGTVISQEIQFTISFPDEEDPYRKTYETVTYDAANDEFVFDSADYGQFITEVHNTGNQPIRDSEGNIIVPTDTTYLQARTATLQVDSPMIAFSIALIPEGDVPIPDRFMQNPTSTPSHYPDFDAANDPGRQLGYFGISDLQVRIGGGEPIYVYESDIVYPFE
ncbi:MAG: hypothetical protein SWH61_14140 [Thermodesulfobacteriota bacterium]|nr:hypothetical protein [Thermodesulfobacteriota bacterium]